MSVLKKILFFLSCFIAALMLLERPSLCETAVTEKTLSSDIVVKEIYQPGSGLPIGKIKAVRGEVLVFHRDPAVGYMVRAGLPLYAGDIIQTGETGWITCRLVDHCQIALMSRTTLAILQSNYNFARKTSASFLQIKQGSARFKLMPLPDLTSYEFRVETETARIMTNNADFVVRADPEITEITTFDNSRLEVGGMSAPEDTLILSDFQRTIVRKEMFSKTVDAVSREEAEAMMAEFHLTPRTNLFAAGPKSFRKNELNDGTQGEEIP